MATVKKHVSKAGVVSYYLRVSNGYNSEGKQIELTKTWKPDNNMSVKTIEKELQRQIVLFEEQVKKGYVFDSSTRFAEYANRWLDNNKPPQLSPKTYERYKDMLLTINLAIGHIRLEKLQSNHLLAFYSNLREPGINKKGSFATSKNLNEVLADRSLNKAAISKLSGVSTTTVSAAAKGERISLESAEKIATAIKMPTSKVFDITRNQAGLSEKTILHYHRLISVILSQATRDRLIPFNIADKDYTRAPRVLRKEAAFLQDYEATEAISMLQREPIKWRTATTLLIYSGMRRGELMGLEWKDIDFDNRVVHITRTSQYVHSMGIITKDTKNFTSTRTIKLPDEAFKLLEEYRAWWFEQQKGMGSKWQYQIKITYADGKIEQINNDRLFIKDDSTPMNPDSLTQWIAGFVERNQLTKFSPHSLRHTNASLLIANGMNIPTVSKRLGHSSVSTTTKIYSHAIQSADEIASDILSAKLNPVKKRLNTA